MIFVDITSCSHEIYEKFLEYIFITCDMVSFHFPNFQNQGVGNILSDHAGGLNKEYAEYLDKNKKLLSQCMRYGAEIKVSNVYDGRKLGHNTKVLRTKLSDFLKLFISKYHLFDFLFPDLPEDLCFYKNGVCRFSSISHEEIFVVQNETKSDLDFLKAHGITHFIRKK